MDPSGDLVIIPPIQGTTAYTLFGICTACLFYGTLLCQGRWYFQTYREDPIDLKLTVAGILIANAVDIALVVHSCYYYAALNALKPETFEHISTSIVSLPTCLCFCIGLCEYVYIRRTYLVIPTRWRLVFVVLIALLCGCGITFATILTVELVKQPTFEHWIELKWLVSAAFAFPVVGDLCLACILSLTLHFSRTGLRRTDALLNSIIINAFRSGIFTSMLSILSLLVAVCEGKNLVILPVSLVASKVYASATLTTLNIRRDLSEILLAPGESELLTGTLTFRCEPRRSERSADDVQAPAESG